MSTTVNSLETGPGPSVSQRRADKAGHAQKQGDLCLMQIGNLSDAIRTGATEDANGTAMDETYLERESKREIDLPINGAWLQMKLQGFSPGIELERRAQMSIDSLILAKRSEWAQAISNPSASDSSSAIHNVTSTSRTLRLLGRMDVGKHAGIWFGLDAHAQTDMELAEYYFNEEAIPKPNFTWRAFGKEQDQCGLQDVLRHVVGVG